MAIVLMVILVLGFGFDIILYFVIMQYWPVRRALTSSNSDPCHLSTSLNQ